MNKFIRTAGKVLFAVLLLLQEASNAEVGYHRKEYSRLFPKLSAVMPSLEEMALLRRYATRESDAEIERELLGMARRGTPEIRAWAVYFGETEVIARAVQGLGL